ncbi:hypothetical protein ERJ75_000821800 [Trypanosoma vivax]|uniref:C3H1-type domain-containing protein n=1 Tax=Trypanosoma vivax (strain Y486) TaxID=1055687 RepID=G0UBJ2_TRYVY|nr:hypothetical protein ERJ75_000821800 [Trypanosoma vivax]CCC53188.1 conserved hypothetical protein [Trypanosoma vivax Y486]
MLQGCDSAKSFLEKLKLGGSAVASIDNNAPPDDDGVVVRRVERQYASEPLTALGLKLTDDGEVLSVDADSPCATANVPSQYMIIAVNNHFVGNRSDFEDIASQHLTLIIKLQSTGAMSELLARILDEEERMCTDGEDTYVNTNDFLKNTPRYGFLSAEHPMFLRWNNRLQTQREARQLLRQATRKAEKDREEEAFEMLKREAEAKEAMLQQQQREQDQHLQCQPNENHRSIEEGKIYACEPPKQRGDEFLLKRVQDESAFGSTGKKEGMDSLGESASPEELLKLIGAEPSEEKNQKFVMSDEIDIVRFFMIPTEEYILSNGLRVTLSLKQRSGPLPNPPPGKPPKGIRALLVNRSSEVSAPILPSNSEVTCAFCYMPGHVEENCMEKKEQERKLALVPKERQICRDYLKGRCSRSDCLMKHVPSPTRKKRSRSKGRDRGRRKKSKDKHRRSSRKRRHRSRDKSRKRASSDRKRRKR